MRYFFLALLVCIISVVALANQVTSTDRLIVTSITPIKYLVQEIVGLDIKVESITDPKDDIHDVMLNYQKRMLLSKAQILIVVDLEKELFLEDALEDFEGEIIELKNVKSIKSLTQLNDYLKDGKPSVINDYHLWLDSDNGFIIAESLIGTIANKFSLDRSLMNKRLVNFRKNLTDMEDKILANTKPYRNISFISAHDSLQYFAKRFDLKYLGGVDLEHKNLSIQERLLLKKKVETDNISYILYEPNMGLDKITPLIEGTKVKTCLVANEYGTDNKGSYIKLLGNIADSLISCFNS